ncbi:hypothetical protein [Mesobacillus subterraneus]|uniref:hypothetical protein n=1 Tax=Mesobacillus subterraneus TaxID=285983 RepID=UPI001CFDDFCE|nr:hypothetical protein [Mesobacillus subterraneus]
MDNNDLILKLNAEQILKHALRYNKLVNYGAPDIVRSSELKLLLTSLCKAIDSTRESGETPNHKDFIDEELVKEKSKFIDDDYNSADESKLFALKYGVYDLFASRTNEFLDFLEVKKEEEAHEGTIDIEDYKKMKVIFKELKEEGLMP